VTISDDWHPFEIFRPFNPHCIHHHLLLEAFFFEFCALGVISFDIYSVPFVLVTDIGVGGHGAFMHHSSAVQRIYILGRI
jgi:hypothetical protein